MTEVAAAPATEPGRRERKREATRLALHRAAVRLAAEHGLEEVTVEAIADAADVSRRTFSNYFSNKEEAILFSDARRGERLATLVANRPDDEGAWAAARGAAEQLVAERVDDPDWIRQLRVLRSHPALTAHQVAAFAVAERDLAEVLAHRLADGPDRELRARLMASTLLAALRIAIRTSLEDPDREAADLLRTLLTVAADPWT